MPKTKTNKPGSSLRHKKALPRKRNRSLERLENIIVGVVVAALVTTIAGLVYLSMHKIPNISDIFLRFQVAALFVGIIAGVFAPRLRNFLGGRRSQRFYAGVSSAALATVVSVFLLYYPF